MPTVTNALGVAIDQRRPKRRMSVRRNGQTPRKGFFFRSTQGTVEATQWDTTAEDLVDANACLPAGAVDALRTSVRRLEMDANLG